jgi:hypothetical protein
MRRTHLLFALLLLGIATFVTAATWVRDDLGGPAPPCYFTDVSGNPTACSATNRLPIDLLPTSGMAPTTATTDLGGWAMQWFTGNVTGATDARRLAPWAVSDNLYYGFQVAEVPPTVDVVVSTDKGRTWTRKQTLSFTAVQWNQVHVAYRLTSGTWLVAGNTGAGTTPTNTGLGAWLTTGTAAQVLLPGLPAGITGGVTSIYQQGTTVLAPYIRGVDSTLYPCRSTNGGVSFTCVGAPVNTAGLGGGKIVDSPAANIWLLGKTQGILRSTNDGVSWTSVLAGAPGTQQVIECLSSTVCLFTDGTASVWRSSDAGATWAVAFTAYGANPLFQAFVDYGGGVVAALPGCADRDVWLSRDSGVNWLPVFRLAGAQQYSSTPHQTTQSSGSAVWSGTPTAFTDKVVYSPSIGAGQVQIVGASNTPLAIDTLGRIVANQGTSAGVTGPWSVYISDGTVSRGFTPNTLAFSPVQGVTLFNSQTTGAANTAVSVTIAAAASTRAHVYNVHAFCSAGTSSLTVTDGGVTKWGTTAAEVGTTRFEKRWEPGLTGETNSAVVATLAACGGGNTGTLHVQADRF